MNPADVNLYLVGFMGTGKTTVGRAVAQKLAFHLVDSDHEIERLQHSGDWQAAGTVASVLRPELLEKAVESGLRSLFVGFETLSQASLR